MQAGKKKKGCGENEFLPACFPPKAGLGGSGSACASAQKQRPQNNPLKEKFARASKK